MTRRGRMTPAARAWRVPFAALSRKAVRRLGMVFVDTEEPPEVLAALR